MKSVTAKSSARQVVSDVKEPEFKRVLNGHTDQVLSAAFTSSMKQLVSGSLDNTVMVWNLKQNMYPWRFTGHTGPVYSIAVSLSGNRIVSGSEDETVRVWKNTEEG